MLRAVLSFMLSEDVARTCVFLMIGGWGRASVALALSPSVRLLWKEWIASSEKGFKNPPLKNALNSRP